MFASLFLISGCQSAGQRAAAELTEQRAQATQAQVSEPQTVATETAVPPTSGSAPEELAFDENPRANERDDTLVPATRLVHPRHAPLSVHSAPDAAFSTMATFSAGTTLNLTGLREVTDTGVWHEVDLYPLAYSGWVPDIALTFEGDPILELWRQKQADEAATAANIPPIDGLPTPVPSSGAEAGNEIQTNTVPPIDVVPG